MSESSSKPSNLQTAHRTATTGTQHSTQSPPSPAPDGDEDDDWIRELKPSGVTLKPHEVTVVEHKNGSEQNLADLEAKLSKFYGEELDIEDEEWLTKELKATDHYAITCACCLSVLGYSSVPATSSANAPAGKQSRTWLLSVPLGVIVVDPSSVPVAAVKKARGSAEEDFHYLAACAECKTVVGRRREDSVSAATQQASPSNIPAEKRVEEKSVTRRRPTIEIFSEFAVAEYRPARPPASGRALE